MRRAFAVVVAAALLLAAAGCGEEETPETTSDWAGSLCTSLNSWTVEMEEIVHGLVTPEESLSAGSVAEALEQAETATQTLRDDVRNLGPPPFENGEQAKSAADESVDTIKEHVDAAKEAAGEETDNLDELLQREVTVLSELKAAGDEATSLLGSLGEASGEVGDALDESDACNDLRSELGS